MMDKMNFPLTFSQFLEDYSFKDTECIYTNGADLIPTFRVQQGLEHFYPNAHWEYKENANDWGIGGWVCSCCGFKNDILGFKKEIPFPISFYAGTKYCGNCGRRMDKTQ